MPARSSGVPRRRAGVISAYLARAGGSDSSSAFIGVSIVPGTIAFTRM